MTATATAMVSTASPGAHGIVKVNPIAKLAVALILGITLVLSLDWVSATVALGFEAVLLPFAGISWRTFWLRTAPVWIAAPLVMLTISLYGKVGGHTFFAWALITISSSSLTLAVATGLRILAIGLPAVVLFVTVDPTDLADGLAQVVHLPARFVLGSLAALRLVSLFRDDWASLSLARRARGVADSGRLRRFAGQLFALLVLSVRRGSKLATAMEARAFGADGRRSWARESRLGWREWLLVAIGIVISSAAVITSVATGHWNFIGS
jgi:energy-coupling factor transport system permease protein